MSLATRQLGKDGPRVSEIGFGAMGLSAFYGYRKSEEDSLKVIQEAVRLGSTFIDTADIYFSTDGMGQNERLIGQLLKDQSFREKVFICTKFGNYALPGPNGKREIRGKPEYVREACEKSLKNLGVDCIDLYYQHRVDRSIPIEDTYGELKKLQAEGKIKHIGISEATSEEIRKANAVVKIAALQIEFSPWTPDILHNGIFDTCKELGIAVVAYSPLGRGFLTGAIKSPDDFEDGDFRKMAPRFSKENFPLNLKLVDDLKALAQKKGVTAGQLALAWCLAQDDSIIPIPGTKSEKYLKENVEAADVKFTKEELDEINKVVNQAEKAGGRYPEAFSKAGAF